MIFVFFGKTVPQTLVLEWSKDLVSRSKDFGLGLWRVMATDRPQTLPASAVILESSACRYPVANCLPQRTGSPDSRARLEQYLLFFLCSIPFIIFADLFSPSLLSIVVTQIH